MRNDDFVMKEDDSMMKQMYFFSNLFSTKNEMPRYMVGHEESDSGHHLAQK